MPQQVSLDPEEIDRLRRRIINVVGHELRTPITTIRGLSERLEHSDERTVHGVLAPALVRNARRVEMLLDDLLVAAGVSTAVPVEHAQTVDLASMAAEVATARGIPPDQIVGSPCPVRVVPKLAERILVHLADNAVRYGEPPIEVRTGPGFVEFRSGCADVDAAELDLAFELFHRGEPAVMAAPGMGLGLPVSRMLARHQGGDLVVTVEGSTVVSRVELPS